MTAPEITLGRALELSSGVETLHAGGAVATCYAGRESAPRIELGVRAMTELRRVDRQALWAPDCYCYRTWNLCPPCVEWNKAHR